MVKPLQQSLGFIPLENISPNPPPTHCPNAVLWAEIADRETEHHFTKKLRCKQWSCPFCAKANSRELKRLVQAGLDAYLARADITEAKFKYSMKFVTLTLPGREYRGSHSLVEAEREVKENLDKLLKQLRKHYGLRDYIWVREAQRGGWAHIHLLMMGGEVWKKDVLPFIVEWWENTYKMGNADVELVETTQGAAHYVAKYVSKGATEGLKSQKVYSMSRGFKVLCGEIRREKRARFTVIRIGALNIDGSYGRILWEVGEEIPLDPGDDTVLQALCEWFAEQSRGVQLTIQPEELC